MKRLLVWSLLLLLGLLLGADAYYSQQPYAPPTLAALRPRLNYLARIIGAGAGPSTALGKLTGENPEWGLFTLSFSTYGLANLAARQPTLRPEAARTMRQAVALALIKPFGQPYEILRIDSLAGYALPRSVLYRGHLNLMLGCLRQLEPATPYALLHDSLSAQLYRDFGAASAGNLPSYPGRRWLPDNAVALASLALHDRLTGSAYGQAGQRWVARARPVRPVARPGYWPHRSMRRAGPRRQRAALTWAGASGFWRGLIPLLLGSSTGAFGRQPAPAWGLCGLTAKRLAATPPARATRIAARSSWASVFRPPPSPTPMPWPWATP